MSDKRDHENLKDLSQRERDDALGIERVSHGVRDQSSTLTEQDLAEYFEDRDGIKSAEYVVLTNGDDQTTRPESSKSSSSKSSSSSSKSSSS